MSAFLGVTSTAFTGINVGKNDDSLQSPDYRATLANALGAEFRYTDILWPRSRSGQAMAGGVFNPDPMGQLWELTVYATGHRHRMNISGQTLNSGGSPVAGVTVMLFNTATGALVDTQTSDAGGNYSVSDPNNVASFVVAYLPGSPDVSGTTVDTLTGT